MRFWELWLPWRKLSATRGSRNESQKQLNPRSGQNHSGEGEGSKSCGGGDDDAISMIAFASASPFHMPLGWQVQGAQVKFDPYIFALH